MTASEEAGPATRARVLSILPALEDTILKGMADWHVPGAAVAVVVDDEVVMAKGFGVRDVTQPAPVGPETVFSIGSTTKAFAAATQAIIVDRGAMGWSDPVIDHFPQFRLADPWVTREFQIGDLLAQRSGLRPNVFDTLWAFGFTADDLTGALRHARPVDSFRTRFSYQNILHSVAGRIVAAHAGVPTWQEAVRQLLFEPLGMRQTGTTLATLAAAPDRATGHVVIDGKPRPIAPPAAFDAVGPAGCIVTSAADIANWLRLLTGRGMVAGRQIVTEANLLETWRPRVQMSTDTSFPTYAAHYALGWIFQLSPNGRSLWHAGGGPLIRSHVGFLPDQRVGFAMLTNEGRNFLQDIAGRWFFDQVLGNPAVDYNTVYDTGIHAAIARSNVPPSPPRPPADLATYVGRYASPITGEVAVEASGDALRIAFRHTGQSFPLRPWSGDTFRIMAADAATESLLGPGESPVLIEAGRDAGGAVVQFQLTNEPEVVLAKTG